MSNTEKQTCHLCKGNKTVTVTINCPICGGTGAVGDNICTNCWGNKKISEERTCPYCLGTGEE